MSEAPKYTPIAVVDLPTQVGRKVHWSKARNPLMHWTLWKVEDTRSWLRTNGGKYFAVPNDELQYTNKNCPRWALKENAK